MERLELCSSVAWGKKLGPFPCTTSSEKWGCWEHALVFRAHPRTFGTLILNPEETMVSQETSQSLPPPVSQQDQKTEGLQHIYLLLAPVFLGVIKEKVSSLPIIKAFFFLSGSLSVKQKPAAVFAVSGMLRLQFCWPFNNFIDNYYG